MADLPQKLPPDVWVVVPAYNEGRRLAATLDKLLAVAQTVVIVDDGSSDDTAEVARRYPVWLLRHVVNLGAGAAVQTGITFALRNGAAYIATLDADNQHEPADLLTLYQTILEQHVDFALGSRFRGRTVGMPWTRRLVLAAAVWFTLLYSGSKVSDPHNGMRMMTRNGASQLRITFNRYEHCSQIVDQIIHSRLPFTEVPVTVYYTRESLHKGQRSVAAVRMGLRLLAERIFG